MDANNRTITTNVVNTPLNTDLKLVRRQLAKGYQQPFILLDSDIVRDKVNRFQQALPRVTPHFAVKANPDKQVLTLLRDLGVQFEIASKEELDILLALDVPAANIFFSNPIKPAAHIRYAMDKGVKWFVIDSVEELHKVYHAGPETKLYLRIYTSDQGSCFPLSSKFGAHREEATAIINAAAHLGAHLAGVTFHVGSQCSNPENWRIALRNARQVFEQMRNAGLTPQLLNLGGGFPVNLRTPAPTIEQIGQVINRELPAFPEPITVMAEPGRYLVADAGHFVCQVIGTTRRGSEHWLYLDAGFYGGLIELKDGLDFELLTDREGPLMPWTIAGPTCDSQDVCAYNQQLPMDMRAGDYVYIRHAGAYSNACASRFNGFPLPDVVLV